MKILILLSVLITSACGMKGDLYLPDEESDAESEHRAGKSSIKIVAFNAVQKT